VRFVAEALNLSPPAAKRLEAREILTEAFIKHEFFKDVERAYKLDRNFGGFESGTLIAKTADGVKVVRGYPKIRRALVLKAIGKRFRGEVVIEEKMNGYNVRVVMFGKNLYAITRGGYICPYTTEKVRLAFETDFFRDHPNLMLCCEAVGEESPFVPKSVYGIKRLEFFVFDIRDMRTNKPIPIREKVRLSEEYGFKLAPILAEVEASKAHEVAEDVIRELGRKGREGIVVKDLEMKADPLKYTTSEANCSELTYAFRFFNEIGRDFMFSRIIREGFQAFEICRSEEEFRERCERLGRAILAGLLDSIAKVGRGERVGETCRLRFYDLSVLELFKEHMRRTGVKARFSEPVWDGDGYVVEMFREMRATEDRIRDLLRGGLW